MEHSSNIPFAFECVAAEERRPRAISSATVGHHRSDRSAGDRSAGGGRPRAASGRRPSEDATVACDELSPRLQGSRRYSALSEMSDGLLHAGSDHLQRPLERMLTAPRRTLNAAALSPSDTAILAARQHSFGLSQEASGDWSSGGGGFVDVESVCFQRIVGVVVLGNTLEIWLETDFPSHLWLWNASNHVFVALFLLEFILRLRQFGFKKHFVEKSRIFDCFLVLLGVLESWILPIFHVHCSGEECLLDDVIRWCLLLRVLRVLRLFETYRELRVVIVSFRKAVQAVMWVGLIIVILSFVLAVILTRVVGRQPAAWEDTDGVRACYSGQCPMDKASEEIENWFGTVYRSMYTLFMVMTLANWPLVVDIVKARFWPIEAFIVVYIGATTYTLMALVTATLSEKMISAVRWDRERQEEEMQEDRDNFIQDIAQLFHECDLDKDGLLSLEDFEKVLYDPDKNIVKHLANLGIAGKEGSLDATEQELLDLLKLIMLDGTPEDRVDIHKFVGGFSRLRGGAKASDLMVTEYEVKHVNYRVRMMEQEMTHMKSDVREIKSDVRRIRRDLSEIISLLGGQQASERRESIGAEKRSSIGTTL